MFAPTEPARKEAEVFSTDTKYNWVFPTFDQKSHLIQLIDKKYSNKKDIFETWTPNLLIHSQAY